MAHSCTPRHCPRGTHTQKITLCVCVPRPPEATRTEVDMRCVREQGPDAICYERKVVPRYAVKGVCVCKKTWPLSSSSFRMQRSGSKRCHPWRTPVATLRTQQAQQTNQPERKEEIVCVCCSPSPWSFSSWSRSGRGPHPAQLLSLSLSRDIVGGWRTSTREREREADPENGSRWRPASCTWPTSTRAPPPGRSCMHFCGPSPHMAWPPTVCPQGCAVDHGAHAHHLQNGQSPKIKHVILSGDCLMPCDTMPASRLPLPMPPFLPALGEEEAGPPPFIFCWLSCPPPVAAQTPLPVVPLRRHGLPEVLHAGEAGAAAGRRGKGGVSALAAGIPTDGSAGLCVYVWCHCVTGGTIPCLPCHTHSACFELVITSPYSSSFPL